MAQPVFDYSAGTPWVVNDAIEEAMAETLAAKGPRVAADALRDEEVRQFRTRPKYRRQWRNAYETAGVNVTSVTMGSRDPALSYARGVERDLARWQARFDAADWLRKVTDPDEARAAAASDDLGVVLNTQNLGAAIEGDLDEIERLYNEGVRIMQLTYNRQNALGTGCTDRSGGRLSHRGVEAVERLNELGAIVDLSHCGTQTTLDAVEVSDRPVAFTHTCCEAVADHDRAKSDSELEKLADVDGYVGIVAVPFFLAPEEDDPSLEVFFDHLDHAISIVGVDRVGIGADFGQIDVDYPEPLADGAYEALAEVGFREEHNVELGGGFDAFARYEDFPVLREGLEERYSEREIEQILGENFLTFWDRVVE